jgi:hypothetical protein
VVSFQVFCPVVLAGLGELPDTVMSRSVIIRMRRRAPGEKVEPFNFRKHAPQGHKIRDHLGVWANVVWPDIAKASPDMPPGIVDRPAEVWEPLLAVADAAGGEWPDLARKACVALCKVASDRRMSLGIRLLGDLKAVWGDAIAHSTETLLNRLQNGDQHGLEADAPWGELHGKPIGTRTLATLLGGYGIKPKKVKVDGRSLQGYRYEDLWDAWQRYLPATPASPELAEPAEPLADLRGHLGSGWVPESKPETEPFRNLQAIVPEGRVPKVPEVPHLRTLDGAL